MVSVWQFWQVSWHKTYLPVGRQVPDALWQGANGVLPRVLHIQASRLPMRVRTQTGTTHRQACAVKFLDLQLPTVL